tara:strand:+ start:2539 stop:2847 length:309 start_codon:yes stop_codon:yes gene_type:complete
MDKTTTWLVRGASLVVIVGGIFFFLESENKTLMKIKSSFSTKSSQPKIPTDKYYYLDLKEKKYFIEANKCRDSQDTTKDEYFDQSYRECMESKGYDPYESSK